MRQTRISIGCQDWQRIIGDLGAEAAGLYLYLRTVMRGMQSAEITVTLSEIAAAAKLPLEAAQNALEAICTRHMSRQDNTDGTVTLRSREETAAQADMFRKRRYRALKHSQKALGQSGYIFFAQNGQSADRPELHADACKEKEYTSEVMMVYDPTADGMSEHTLFDHTGQESKKEKNPPTPKKEKSLTESTGHAHASAPVREAELPVDKLEDDYIDVCGLMPQSLRDAIRMEQDDVREAFYLYVRQRREEEGSRWAGDRIRIAWLAARRIPAERRAESILAAAMGSWKTIRDAGSGCYFERSTGRVVSLVRGVIDRDKQPQTGQTETALRLARNMRRA